MCFVYLVVIFYVKLNWKYFHKLNFHLYVFIKAQVLDEEYQQVAVFDKNQDEEQECLKGSLICR